LRLRAALPVFLGGALGSVSRYLVSLTLTQALWLTVVNLLGAALLGVVQTSKRFEKPSVHAFWGTGFCGGFTTLSSLITFATLGNDWQFVFAFIQIALGLGVYIGGRRIGRVVR